MSENVRYEEAYKRYLRKRSSVTDGMIALESASTVEEAMGVYNIADGRNGHHTCCKAAFSKALGLSTNDLDLDRVLASLNETGLTSYRHEVMKVFEKVDTLGLKVEQMGIMNKK